MTPPGIGVIEFTRTRTTEGDRLPDYASLLAWAAAKEVITPMHAGDLRAYAAEHPRQAVRVHAEAVRLRDDLYAYLKGTSQSEGADTGRLSTLNAVLRKAAEHRVLVFGPGGHEWSWDDSSSTLLESPLWRIAQDAADLLTSPRLDRLGVCAADTCQWLFIDESRNRSRRWCDMSDCGTRDKVRRFRARERSQKG